MKKRVLSFILAAVMLFGLVVPVYGSEGQQADVAVTAEDMAAEGTSSTGRLIAKELEGKLESPAGDCGIVGLTVSGTTATVDLYTAVDGYVLVSIYEEDTGKMVTSGSAPVAADAQGASVTLEDSTPQYFLATAFLMDEEYTPLCEEYTTNEYTQAMQEFLSKDTDDFASDRVVNLDESIDNNFMVLNQAPVTAEADSAKNVITDNGDGTYTITNADETFTTLAVGKVVYYEYGDGELLLVKVKEIKIDGTTVTITEDPTATLADFFEYIKIDVGSDGDQSEIMPTAVVDEEEKISFKFGANLVNTAQAKVSVSVSGTIKLSIYYEPHLFKDDEIEVEFTTTQKITGEVKLSGKLEKTQDLAPVSLYPLPGLKVKFTPYLVFRAEAEGSYSLSYGSTLGFSYDGDWHNKSKPAKWETELKIEGTIFMGMGLEPSISLVSENLIKVSTEIEFGPEIKAEWSVKEEEGEEEYPPSKHTCQMCLEGTVGFRMNVSAKVEICKVFEAKATVVSALRKWLDFHYSQDYDEFALTKCKHTNWRVRMTVVDQAGTPVPNAVITGEAIVDEGLPIVTDDNGLAVAYMPEGLHRLTVTWGDVPPQEATVDVKGKATDTVLTFTGAVMPTPTPKPSGGEGESIQWRLDDRENEYGTKYTCLVISGTGQMNNYAEKGAPWYAYKDEIDGLEIQEGVTSVGAYAFYDMKFNYEFRMADTVATLGEGSFSYSHTMSLDKEKETVHLSAGLKEIGKKAFYDADIQAVPGSDSLNDNDHFRINLPEGLTTIGESAFENCKIYKVGFPASLRTIGDRAFWMGQLSAAYLRDGVETIGKEAFGSLSYIHIPTGIQSLGYHAVTSVRSAMDGGNGSTVFTRDGVLFQKGNWVFTSSGEYELQNTDKITLLLYPSYAEQTSYTVPQDVWRIEKAGFPSRLQEIDFQEGSLLREVANEAFSSCSSLTRLVFPDGLEKLEKLSLSGCSALKELDLPDTLKPQESGTLGIPESVERLRLPGNAKETVSPLWSYENLKVVYFNGTRQQFDDYMGVCPEKDNGKFTANVICDHSGRLPAEDTLAASEPMPAAETTLDPEMTLAPEVTPVPETTVEPEVTAAPEVTLEPEITAAPEVTAEPEVIAVPEVTAAPVPEVTAAPEPVPESAPGIEPAFSSGSEPGDIELVSKYTGSADGERAIFNGLVSGQAYILLARIGDDPLAPGALTFAAQMTAESGQITFTYKPKTEGGEIRAYGPASQVLTAGDVKATATAAPAVTYKGTSLTAGKDYRFRWVGLSNGYAAEVRGIGAYSGTVTVPFLTDVKLSQSSYKFDGRAKQPDVTVTVGGAPLTKGTDYTVTYTDNVSGGTATVTVTGAGNYSGTATATFTIEGDGPAYSGRNGWVSYNGLWYYFQNGALLTNAWVKDAGKWYWVDENGVMATNQVVDSGRYYVNGAGVMATGWINIGGGNYYYAAGSGLLQKNVWVRSGKTWYWMQANGLMARGGPVNVGGSEYYFTDGGAMRTGWISLGGLEYKYATGSGAIVRNGWAKVGRAWYYFGEDGKMYHSGSYDIGGQEYYFAPSGAMLTGWIGLGGLDYKYANGSGMIVKSAWAKIGRVWYYLGADGKMYHSGSYDIGGQEYYFAASGAMCTGWINLDSGNYKYANGSGAIVKNAWVKDGRAWYYLDGEGMMYHDTNQVIGGSEYYFASNGAMRTGWINLGGGDYKYAAGSGAITTNQWLKSGRSWYWLKGDGMMARNETLLIKGVNYTFNNAGVWVA